MFTPHGKVATGSGIQKRHNDPRHRKERRGGGGQVGKEKD